MSFLSRVFKRKKNDDDGDGDLAGLDELEADEKEGLFIDTSARVETAAGPAAPAAVPAAVPAAAPLDAGELETARPPGPEPVADVPTADEANQPAPAAAPASEGPTAGAVAEAQIAAAQAQTAAAEAQIAAAEAPAAADPLEDEGDGDDGSLELDQDEAESPEGERTEEDGDGEDEDDPLSAFRTTKTASFASGLTKDLEDVTMEEIVAELREVRSMLPTIGGESSTEPEA